MSAGRFGPDFFPSLRELGKHNDREWFTANKAQYLDHVQAPTLAFVRVLGPKLEAISSHLIADARPAGGSVMRIYRDTRFSKDKSPYRTSVGIHFMYDAPKTGEDHFPGFFLHLAPGDSWVYAGIWEPAAPMLEKIRRVIAARPADWKKVRAAVPEIEGDRLKRPPQGFDPEHPLIEDLKRKGFTAGFPFQDPEVVAENFPERFVARCRERDPLNRFLAKAVGIDY